MTPKYVLILIISIALNILVTKSQQVDPREVRCHVCRITIQEMEEAVGKVDPKKKAEVSGFRLDAKGNSVTKTIQLVKSEMYLTDLMESVCKKMDDYAKAIHKKTGKLNVVKMINSDGNMNSDISSYDFVQDGDLNKSLEHYCLEILEDQEEEILKYFMSETLENDIDIKVCLEKAKYCKGGPIQDEYKLEDEL